MKGSGSSGSSPGCRSKPRTGVLPCALVPGASFPRVILKSTRETPANSSLPYLSSLLCEVRYMELAWWVVRKTWGLIGTKGERIVRRSVGNLPFCSWACVEGCHCLASMLLSGRLVVFSARPTFRDLKAALEQPCWSLFLKVFSEKYIQSYNNVCVINILL